MDQFDGLVFLSSQEGGRSRRLAQDLLGAANIEYTGSESTNIQTDPLQSLRSSLDPVVAVVAVLESLRPSHGVVLEIGAALGRGIPVVLLLSDKVDRRKLSAALRELPSMALTKDPSSSASRRLRALLQEGWDDRSRSASTAEGSPSRPGRRSREWSSPMEARAVGALESVGGDVVLQPATGDPTRPDMTVWLPYFDDPNTPFNPIPVEVVAELEDVVHKRQQLLADMQPAGALFGLLITPYGRPQWTIRKSGAVLTVGVDDLEATAAPEFELILRDGRNRLFHAA